MNLYAHLQTKNKTLFFQVFLLLLSLQEPMKKRNDIQRIYGEILTFSKSYSLAIKLKNFQAEKQQNEEIADCLQDNFPSSKI